MSGPAQPILPPACGRAVQPNLDINIDLKNMLIVLDSFILKVDIFKLFRFPDLAASILINCHIELGSKTFL